MWQWVRVCFDDFGLLLETETNIEASGDKGDGGLQWFYTGRIGACMRYVCMNEWLGFAMHWLREGLYVYFCLCRSKPVHSSNGPTQSGWYLKVKDADECLRKSAAELDRIVFRCVTHVQSSMVKREM